MSEAQLQLGRADGAAHAVVTIVIVVSERAPGVFDAELEAFPALRESGGSRWEAVNRLVGSHRALLERRWSS